MVLVKEGWLGNLSVGTYPSPDLRSTSDVCEDLTCGTRVVRRPLKRIQGGVAAEALVCDAIQVGLLRHGVEARRTKRVPCIRPAGRCWCCNEALQPQNV
jgi:hypothetical protein